MTTSDRTQVVAAVLAGLVAVAAGCGRSGPADSAGQRPGEAGTSWLLTVSRQPGGTVTSKDGRIDCGTAETATRCGPVAYAWAEAATLVAAADAGSMFGTWAGDCAGRTADPATGEYVCVLDTTRSGADKYVVAVFGEPGLTQHENFSDPAKHGPAFYDWLQGEPDAFACKACHGAEYQGVGIALSCNACHEQAGFPGWQTNCQFCHASPPPAPHPTVSTDLTTCTNCHATTVDGSGVIVPGGTHLDGTVDGGHEDGYVAPAVHGRDFFASVAGATTSTCSPCHGATFERVIVSGDRSCNSCHAERGWAGWQTNCSFCHGVKDATTQAGYDVALQPVWSAPPDAISERLDGVPVPERTGAHTVHLTGSAYARPFACDACHLVPATLSHISGRDVPAAVALRAPGQAGDPDPLGYDPISGTCATACHGVNPSPAWSSTGLACDGCHAVPPATPAHAGLTGADLGQCVGCHPSTFTPEGAIDQAGAHLNGTVDSVEGHEDGFAVNAVHGPQYLDFVAGVTGAQDCESCHGASASSCDACHSSSGSGGWVSWRTNCTFCHGTRTPAYAPAQLALASPPDAISQRLTGVATSTARKTGKHRPHVDGAPPYYPPVPCAACHAVPSDVRHVSADRRATVAIDLATAFPHLTPAQVAALPGSPGAYDPVTSRCAVYCHGDPAWGPSSAPGPNPTWSTASATANCTSCHGQPPPTGKRMPEDDYCLPLYPAADCSLHEWHLNVVSTNGWDGCNACHDGFAHLNGVTDLGWYPGKTGTWDPVAKTCAVSCHSTPTTPRSWN